MPDINNIIQKNEKRIAMDDYFGEGAYITIKKITRSNNAKMQLLNSESGMTALLVDMYKKGEIKSFESVTELDNREIGIKIMSMPAEVQEKSAQAVKQIEQILFGDCVDPEKHNLTANGEKIILGVEFWEQFSDGAEYVMQKINEFNSEVFCLGESIENK